MCVVGFGGGFIFKFTKQYNIRITLFKKIGTTGIEAVTDWAKIVTDGQNKTKLQLLKTKKGKKKPCTLPVPEAKYKGKRGKYDHYTLWMDDNFELHPVNNPVAESNFERLKIRPQERSAL